MDRQRYPHSTIRNLTYLKKMDFIVGAALVEAGRLGRSPEDVPVLEIGCNTGNVTLSLAEAGFPVIGVEIDQAKAEKAQARNPYEHARIVNRDMEDWDQEERFPVVVCSEVLEHLEQPAEMARRIVGLTEPGGMAVITVPNGYGPWELLAYRWNPLRLVPALLRWIRLAAGRLPFLRKRLPVPAPYPKGERHIQQFTYRSITRLLEQSGLEVVAPEGRSCFLAPVFPFSLCRRWSGLLWPLESLDMALADKLPRFASCGWYFRCRRL
jgi:SAM-dependent methyltransferase